MKNKSRYSTAYVCISLFLILFLLFVPMGSRWGVYISGITSLKHTGLIERFLGWWLLGGVAVMVVGLILNYCENNNVVKCIRIFLNLALLFAIFVVISVLGQHHFKNTAGTFVLFVAAVTNLVLSIVMAFSRKNKTVTE